METSTSTDAFEKEKNGSKSSETEEEYCENTFNGNKKLHEDVSDPFDIDDCELYERDGDPVLSGAGGKVGCGEIAGGSNASAKTDFEEKQTKEELKPKFSKSHFSRILRKGSSRVNISKGKGRQTKQEIYDYFIDMDLLTEMSSKSIIAKRIHDLVEKSHQLDTVERVKNTLVSRISDLDKRDLLSLSDVVALFLNQRIPISLKMPASLTEQQISNLLIVQESSNFVQAIASDINLQDILRKAVLNVKKLPVCCCGYIYVHPSLTFSRHPENRATLIGKLSPAEVASESKEKILEKLDAMRFFLEILYEYHCQ